MASLGGLGFAILPRSAHFTGRYANTSRAVQCQEKKRLKTDWIGRVTYDGGSELQEAWSDRRPSVADRSSWRSGHLKLAYVATG
jgi:hypothetical protein